ncbi:hypothetical protein Q3G72_007720 [Acer saccharum]|nr:hypothetical protein Q3G72_007720 [Acer saccharum]
MAMCILVFLTLLILPSSHSSSDELYIDKSAKIPQSDLDLLEFPLNLEYFEAEFFLYGALGYGLDKAAPKLTGGGPTPLGAKKANLDPFTRDVVLQFAYQEVGHLSSLNYLIASYLIPYVGLTGYVGANEKLENPVSRRLVAGLLGVESGQDAVIRALLYEKATQKVPPYGITVAEFTNKISSLRNKLGHTGLKDEGLIVQKSDGAEGKIAGNVLAGDQDSVAYARTPEEILRIVYGSGDEGVPGGFYPKGGDGRIARFHLKSA